MASPVVSISPHLDDLALSCGAFLSGRPDSVLVTVFAGGPPTVDPLPWWDEECGVVQPGDDVVGIRRAEDRCAADVLGGTVRHLSFWDNHYREPVYDYPGPTDGLAATIATEFELLFTDLEAPRWLVPLGILHPDHRLTASACLDVAERHPDVLWYLYEDLPYATRCPRDREIALALLGARGFTLEPDPATAEPEASLTKRAAVECYRSQLSGLGDQIDEALDTPERIFRLVPAG